MTPNDGQKTGAMSVEASASAPGAASTVFGSHVSGAGRLGHAFPDRHGNRRDLPGALYQPGAAAIPEAKETAGGPSPHPIDTHVGARVRLRRQLLGMNQKELAAQLGLSFQQIQKFERGKDRIAASRLYEIAAVLNVPISFFFDALPDPDARVESDKAAPVKEDEERLKETLNLVRAYRNVLDPALRKRILDLIRSMGEPVLLL